MIIKKNKQQQGNHGFKVAPKTSYLARLKQGEKIQKNDSVVDIIWFFLYPWTTMVYGYCYCHKIIKFCMVFGGKRALQWKDSVILWNYNFTVTSHQFHLYCIVFLPYAIIATDFYIITSAMTKSVFFVSV